MAKKLENSGDAGLVTGVKSAKMTGLTEKTLRKAGMPGLYAVGSAKLRVIGIWTSRDVGARVRKFLSDYKLGRRIGILEQMGIRFAADVVFQVLEECPEEMWRMRMRHWADEAKGKGYTIWNSWEEATGQGRRDAGPWAPAERVMRIMDRFGIPEGEMLDILDTLERGLAERRAGG